MFKFSKKFFSLIMAILMLSMAAIGVSAEELIIGVDDLLEAVEIIEHDHEEEELIALAASSCHVHTDSCYRIIERTVCEEISEFDGYGNIVFYCTMGYLGCRGGVHEIIKRELICTLN